MSFSDYYENAVLAHLFQNLAIINIGDVTGLDKSTTDGALWVALHTASPSEAGDQTTSEAAYTGYARVSVARSASWTVAANQVTNAAAVQFPTSTGGTATVTHFSVGVDDGATLGVNTMIAFGALASPLTIVSGVQPQFAAGALVITLD
jgi:hypothetical protein